MKENKDHVFTLSVSKKGYPSKPRKEEISGIRFESLQLTTKEALNCANEGKVFCYTFNTDNSNVLTISEKKTNNFVSTSTIIYDFDDMDINMMDYIEKITYKPSFAYSTYSDGKNEKSRFRLAYVFDKDIYGKENFDLLYNAIANANEFVEEKKGHGGWDKREVNQMYYGTTSLAKTYNTDYVYNISDFERFTTPVNKEVKAKNKQTKELSSNKYNNISEAFLKDLNNLSHKLFYSKYYDDYGEKYFSSLRTRLKLSSNGMWYDYPEFYVEVMRKRRGKYIERWKIGEDRKKKLYVTAHIMIYNCPDITLENLIFNLEVERYFYYDNGDKKIDDKVLVETAKNAFTKDFTLKPSRHGQFKINKAYWEEQGVGIRQAIGYVRKMKKAEEILPYYDFNMSIPQNFKILMEKGIKKISLRTLQRLVSDGYICREDTLLSECQSQNKDRDILELMRKNDRITVREIATSLGISKSTVKYYIKQMQGKCINREGNNRSGRWIVNETDESK